MRDLDDHLGHRFHDKDLIKRALTHASADARASNERLEFLGDRVLGLVIAEKLHDLFPHDSEGALALKLNALVRKEACAQSAEAAHLDAHLILASSEAGSGGRKKAVILAGACEAVIAALYLDGGMEAARNFILRYWESQFATLGGDMRDAKTALQEWAQAKKGGGAPAYRTVSREGPDHAPSFEIEVRIRDAEPAIGTGRSKREAEQAAAKALLESLGVWKT